MRRALAPRPAASLVAQAAGDRLPSYVTREQARAIINAAATTTHRLLLESLRQSGGRVTEVLGRRHDVSTAATHQRITPIGRTGIMIMPDADNPGVPRIRGSR